MHHPPEGVAIYSLRLETAHFGRMDFEPVKAGTDKLSILQKRKDGARRV